jgi:hypothetical protein
VKPFTKAYLVVVAALLAVLIPMHCQSIPWITRSYSNDRSGWNTNEQILTQQGVELKGISLRKIIPLCCDARGMEAQPLIVPNVNGHDMMILATMSDAVEAVDAHTGVPLWDNPGQTFGAVQSSGILQLGVPVTSTRQIDMWGINQHIGCMSTGVVNLATKRLYQVCWVSQDGSGNASSGKYEMFVIDITTGKLVVPGVLLQGTDDTMWKQRASLVLTTTSNGGKAPIVFIAHGSIYETSTGYTGGITVFDATLNEVTNELPMTAGIWMAGQGLVADAQGYLYAVTGNGDFDPANGFYGEAFIKLRYTYGPPSKSSLAVIDQWSPWNDYQRNGKTAPYSTPGAAVKQQSITAPLVIAGQTHTITQQTVKMAGVSAPSEAVRPVGGSMAPAVVGGTLQADISSTNQLITRVYPMATGAWSDEDWGSAGPACIFELDTCVAAGKDGIGYPINSYHLGQTTAGNVGTAGNYAKLRSPCVWLTMSPGNVPCDPTDLTKLNFFPNGLTAHLHATPPHIYDPVLKSWVIFPWGENSALHKWKVSATGGLTYVAEGNEFASVDVRNRMPGGMPGGFCTASSNGNDEASYILACVIPYGDANKTVTNGRLLVYDPIHLSVDGSLQVLWDSQAFGIAFTMNKFLPPVIDGGDIIVPDFSGRVLVFRY